MELGIQLFGVLQKHNGSVMETLQALRQMGFSRIEPCLSLEPIPGMEQVIWPIQWFEANAKAIRELNLDIFSAHVFVRDIAKSAGRLKQLAAENGIGQLVVKTPSDMSDDSLQRTAEQYMQTADTLAKAGTALLLHNEKDDIQTIIHQMTAYEYLLKLCRGQVGAQVDIGWVYAGGQDPETMLHRLKTQVKSLHYKDFCRKEGSFAPVLIGSGDVDTAACFRFAQSMGIPHIIDQDEFTGDPLEACRQCFKAVQQLSQRPGC